MRLIAAADEAWGIGQGGALLYHTRADMARVKALTMGHVLLMGGKTFRSLPGLLLGRVHVVLTRTPGQDSDRLRYCTTPEGARALLSEYPAQEHFLFGGGEIYRLFLADCTRADITRYAGTRPADTYLPRLDTLPDWRQITRSPWQIEGGLRFCFETWKIRC
ncbi:MAG: dihydrofolate reductase [Oscillospiraceae bacterium]|jgi:dihydrofolate reductase|nr:dihydrofolate reductase [Oscillospiraceae bacterium]